LATDTVKIDQCKYRPGGLRFTTAAKTPYDAVMGASSSGCQRPQDATIERKGFACVLTLASVDLRGSLWAKRATKPGKTLTRHVLDLPTVAGHSSAFAPRLGNDEITDHVSISLSSGHSSG
jgi:hypothetical protein